MKQSDKPNLADWLGFETNLVSDKTRWLGHTLGFASTFLGLIALILVIGAVTRIAMALLSLDAQPDMRGMGLILAALIGAPFVVWRTHIANRQAETDAEGLTTDRITKAVAGLGAEKTVVEVIKVPQFDTTDPGKATPITLPNGAPFEKTETIEKTVPNLEVRIGAIYALERIAQDSPRDHIQIMEILCAYIRENSNARKPAEFPEPMWELLADNATPEERHKYASERQRRFGATFFESLAWRWARSDEVPLPRTDIQVALEVIGRRPDAQIELERNPSPGRKSSYYRLDLSGSNLQRANLAQLDFRNTLFAKARLEGANLSSTRLNGANLREARLEGANLQNAWLQGANLEEARLERAYLRDARLKNASLIAACLEGANLWEARLKMANLREARLEGANLVRAQMGSAVLVRARLRGANLWGTRLERANLREVQLEEANLREARLDGADLREARFDAETNFRAAIVHCAALKSTDISMVSLDQDQVNSLFGDGSVNLPAPRTGEVLEWPSHWPEEDIDWPEFEEQWRAWQKEQGYTPP